MRVRCIEIYYVRSGLRHSVAALDVSQDRFGAFVVLLQTSCSVGFFDIYFLISLVLTDYKTQISLGCWRESCFAGSAQ
jgi:hypothetical protein